MNPTKIARSSHEEALNLVRRVPAVKTSWVYARAVGNFLYRQNKRCWAELRGNTLLLHVVGEQSSRANAEQLAKRTPSENIMMITLKEARVNTDVKNNKIKIRRSNYSSHGEKNIEIKLKDSVETKKWHTSLVNAATQRKFSLNDFQIILQVGKGASGRVFLVKDRTTNERLALKVIEKQSVYENDDSYRHALDERLVLEMACDHPFILNLRYAFQSQNRLYLVTEYCDGGDLFDYLKKRGKPFKENEGKRIAGEILLALEHIHSLGVVYRDLKLENVLLDLQGHVRIADFGLSKLLDKKKYIANMSNQQQQQFLLQQQLQKSNINPHNNRAQSALQPSTSSSSSAQHKPVNNLTKTFCGTREYVAPEMLSGNEYGQSVDLWAFGILLYEILCGRTPFYSRNREEVYSKIEHGALRFPRNLSHDVVSLIRGLLDRNPNTRLGLGPEGINEIKNHAFFRDMDWQGLYHKIAHKDNIVVEKSMVEQVAVANSHQVNSSDHNSQDNDNGNMKKNGATNKLLDAHHQQQQYKATKLAQINQNNNVNNNSSQIVDEAHVFGKDADALLEDEVEAGGDKKRPDIFAMFVATKKKATNIAGYSYMAPASAVAPTIPMDGIASREDLPN